MRLTFLALPESFDWVEPGFRPHENGVEVRMGGQVSRPRWCLVSDMPIGMNPGLPQCWCTDGHRIYFDRPASRDSRVTACDKALS